MKTTHATGLIAVALLVSACESPVEFAREDSGGAPAHPFPGAALYVDPWHPAHPIIDSWRDSRPEDARLLEGIAETSQAVWLSGGAGDAQRVGAMAQAAASAGAVPVFVAYNIPRRNCGSGGASGASSYRNWVEGIASALGGRAALFVLEPDAVPGAGCLSAPEASARYGMIADAARTLQAAGAAVYIDAGHPRWLAVDEIARRLVEAGIGDAHGFALNVANFIATAENVTYGDALSAELDGFGYVIDTGRNGAGPHADGEWCNPPGRALGDAPTLDPDRGRAHAFLWLKRPGESDGTCNGGPPSGSWWTDYALGLASRAG